MNCPKCGVIMQELNQWQMAPYTTYGGFLCPCCGLLVSRKSQSSYFKYIDIFKY